MTANEPIASGFDEAALTALKTSMQGEVLRPSDDGHEPARHNWNGMIDRRPAGIARCHGAADVQAAVALAREHQVLVAVRGGGRAFAVVGSLSPVLG